MPIVVLSSLDCVIIVGNYRTLFSICSQQYDKKKVQQLKQQRQRDKTLFYWSFHSINGLKNGKKKVFSFSASMSNFPPTSSLISLSSPSTGTIIRSKPQSDSIGSCRQQYRFRNFKFSKLLRASLLPVSFRELRKKFIIFNFNRSNVSL